MSGKKKRNMRLDKWTYLRKKSLLKKEEPLGRLCRKALKPKSTVEERTSRATSRDTSS